MTHQCLMQQWTVVMYGCGAAGTGRWAGVPAASVRASRNAALIALAADLPTTVVSDLLGLNITTAVNWTRRAGRDWHSYLAAETLNRRR
jgi:hypothetical protein